MTIGYSRSNPLCRRIRYSGMEITKNELLTLCQKAYMGLHRFGGEPDKISQMVLNNELLGLPGASDFARGIQDLSQETSAETFPRYRMVGHRLLADLYHVTIMVTLPVWWDIAMKHLTQEMELQLDNTSQRWLVVGSLMELKKEHDISIQATWVDHSRRILSIFHRGEMFPDIYQTVPDGENQDHRSITITFRKDGSFDAPTDFLELRSSTGLEAHYRKQFDRLITIPEETMNILTQSAKRILVKSTPESEKGAGE